MDSRNQDHLGKHPGTPARTPGDALDSGDLGSASLQILYEVVSSINTAHGVDDLLTRFLFALKRVTGAKAAAIWVAHIPNRIELAASSGACGDVDRLVGELREGCSTSSFLSHRFLFGQLTLLWLSR